jgi:LPS-assembly protein
MRLFFAFFLLATLLYATKEQIDIYAGSVDTQNNIYKLNGSIVVVYDDYILTAQSGLYNRSTGILELFDQVKLYRNKQYKVLGGYAKLNIQKKQRTFKPFYMLEEQSQVWMSAQKGCAKEQLLEIKSGVVSGCDPKDPLWQIEFSSSDYNTETKWLNLYNTILYIYDIPVLYTPYFGYVKILSRIS